MKEYVPCESDNTRDMIRKCHLGGGRFRAECESFQLSFFVSGALMVSLAAVGV